VSEGQQVLVRFSGYPYHEFGSVYGEVEYFSEFPVRDSLFFAKVSFPNGLQTSYGHTIPPRNGMTGRAEIITEDMRLLERVYNNITKELR
jgi:HlyD family secretion protein